MFVRWFFSALHFCGSAFHTLFCFARHSHTLFSSEIIIGDRDGIVVIVFIRMGGAAVDLLLQRRERRSLFDEWSGNGSSSSTR